MSLTPGLIGTAETVVTEANTAAAAGSGSLQVFSTPMMIALMENAACSAVQPYLTEGETTVGTQVAIKHLAATPLGMSVRAEARLGAVEGRRLVFTVAAFDGVEKIGEGTHERFVVAAERFLSKVEQKG